MSATAPLMPSVARMVLIADFVSDDASSENDAKTPVGCDVDMVVSFLAAGAVQGQVMAAGRLSVGCECASLRMSRGDGVVS